MAETQKQNTQKPGAPAVPDPSVIDEILKAIAGIRFGTVHIVVQDCRVVQIDKTEKIRLT